MPFLVSYFKVIIFFHFGKKKISVQSLYGGISTSPVDYTKEISMNFP